MVGFAGDWVIGWLLLTRFREVISPTAGGNALAFCPYFPCPRHGALLRARRPRRLLRLEWSGTVYCDRDSDLDADRNWPCVLGTWSVRTITCGGYGSTDVLNGSRGSLAWMDRMDGIGGMSEAGFTGLEDFRDWVGWRVGAEAAGLPRCARNDKLGTLAMTNWIRSQRQIGYARDDKRGSVRGNPLAPARPLAATRTQRGSD